MPETITPKEEQQIIAAAKTATDLVSSGLTPDAAVEKVARDQGFGPGKIRLIGQAYNTGQQLSQWRTDTPNILDKLASFPLCDPQSVIDAIYKPKEKEASVHPEYAKAPNWFREKKASVKLPEGPKVEPYKPEPSEALHKAYGQIQRCKQAAEEARRQASTQEDRVRSSVAHLVTYFRKSARDRLAFDVVESVAREYHGSPATVLMNVVYQNAHLREKRAGDNPTLQRTPINQRTEPFTLIKEAVDAATRCTLAKEHAAGLVKAAKLAEVEELRPFVRAGKVQQPTETGPWLKEAAVLLGTEKVAFGFGTEVAAIAAGDILAHKATHGQSNEDPYGDVSSLNEELDEVQQEAKKRKKASIEKTAFLGVGLGSAIGSSLGRTMGSMPKTKDDMVEDAWMGLEDPEHENALRKIKAHAMINQLMTDPDDPISAHDPDRVLSAYNEISASTPRVAENAATLRPALRKRLEGHQEPFEAKELIDIEHGLAKAKMPTPNTSILGDTPDKLLG